MDDQKDPSTEERGERDVARDHQERRETPRRREAGERVEREDGPEAGRDPLAPLELEIDRIVVPEDARQREQDGEIAGRMNAGDGLEPSGEAPGRQEALGHVEEKDRPEPPEPDHPRDVGGADVPRALRPDVDALQDEGKPVSERDRADQIGGEDRKCRYEVGHQVAVPFRAAVLSSTDRATRCGPCRPCSGSTLCRGPPRNSDRRAAYTSFAVA